MAKQLPYGQFSIDDLVINWEDDIYADFPSLELRENGLTLKDLTDLVSSGDNMVRGITKSGAPGVDGLVAGKLQSLTGSLENGWDRTSWPIPFIRVNGENQIFDRRHTFFVLGQMAKECHNVSQVPTAEYVRVKSDKYSEAGQIINKFSDASIQMMASMWGNNYGPVPDDTKDYQFVGSITKILRQEKEFLSVSKNIIFTKELIKEIFKYMGGERRYPKDARTQNRIINGVYANVHEKNKKKVASGKPCINNNIKSYTRYIQDSDEWLPNNKEDKVSHSVYRNYVFSNNTYHMTDVARKFLKSVCREEQSLDPRTTKSLLYNQADSDNAEAIEESRELFCDTVAEMYYPIRDSVLKPVKEYLGQEFFNKIPQKSLNDFNFDVYAMHQIEGEEEPVKLTFPDSVIKKSR